MKLMFRRFVSSLVVGVLAAVILLLTALLLGLSPAFAQTESTACGGSSQPRCQVYAPIDQDTSDQVSGYTNVIASKNNSSKKSADSITSASFQWTFIPQIPTAACTNPQIQSPIHGNAVEMDVCKPFNTFGSFINGVLAFFCVLGCVQQVRAALAA